MLVIITIVISPLVIIFFKYRWWNVHRTLETQEEGYLVKVNLLTRRHVDETIIIMVEHKRTRIPCKNSAMSGGSKHKILVFNCIIVLIIRLQKLIFEQYPWTNRGISNDGNKLVEDSNNFIVLVIPRAVGNSTNCYLP